MRIRDGAATFKQVIYMSVMGLFHQIQIWCVLQLHKEKNAAKLLILLVDMCRQVVIIRMDLKDARGSSFL
jgi:hypothetical protein